MFGCPENERKLEKVRENGKEKESRKLPANFITEQKVNIQYSACLGAFIAKPPLQIKKKNIANTI